MFPCMKCTKATTDEEEERVQQRESGTPQKNEAVKSLTSQIKDMALKISGANKQSKPSTGSSSNRSMKPYPDSYMGGVSSNSTPAWDFTNVHFPGFAGRAGDYQTPTEHDTIASSVVVEVDQDLSREWIAHVEPGVHITFISLPDGGNDLKRIRFRRDMFNRVEAQRWWGDNYDRIMELYNVKRFSRYALNTPTRSEDEQEDFSFSRATSESDSPMGGNQKQGGGNGEKQQMMHAAGPSMAASRAASSSNASGDMVAEWIEQDQPGVFVTIRRLADGAKELRRVRFSREIFEEQEAKQWWEENRTRIQAQYL